MTARKQMSVAGYLAALPADRRRELKAVLDLVRHHVPADDLALDAIAEVVGSTSVDSFVALAQAARRPGKARSSARR